MLVFYTCLVALFDMIDSGQRDCSRGVPVGVKLDKFFNELKQRKIYRVAALYAAAAWLLLQVADVVLESFPVPGWLMQGLIVAATLGFPLALLVAWMLGPRSVEESGDTLSAPDSTEPLALSGLGDKPSIVVLPFDCYSEQVSDRWYTDALTEDLTTLISRIPGFFVVARNTAFTYKGKSVDVRSVGEDLGVRYVLEGSVRRSEKGMRVTAQLIETATGTHLWAEKYDRGADDLEQLHDELCLAIVFKLGAELTRAEVNLSRQRPPAEWGVWELYQQARGMLQFYGWSRKTFSETADLLRQAIAIDPEFAPAHAFLSLILALGHWTRLITDRDAAYEAAVAAAEKAMELAPESSEVLGFVGCALSDLGQPERGIPVIDRAIELDPSNSQAFAALGAAKVISGKLQEGITDLKHAIRISPADPGMAPWSTILSIGECFSGHEQEALQWAHRAIKADPRYFGAYMALAVAHFRLEQHVEAQKALTEAKRLNPELTEESIVAMIGASTWSDMTSVALGIPDI